MSQYIKSNSGSGSGSRSGTGTRSRSGSSSGTRSRSGTGTGSGSGSRSSSGTRSRSGSSSGTRSRSGSILRVLVLCATDESIQIKKSEMILDKFISTITRVLKKEYSDIEYYFLGPDIIEYKEEYNICPDVISNCTHIGGNKKFDIIISEMCPTFVIRGVPVMQDIVDLINTKGKKKCFFIAPTYEKGKYDFPTGWTDDRFLVPHEKNRWNYVESKTGLSVLKYKKHEFILFFRNLSN